MSVREFHYQAVTPDGKTTNGRMSGASDREVVLRLQKLGLTPLSVDLALAGAAAASPAKPAGKFLGKTTPRPAAKATVAGKPSTTANWLARLPRLAPGAVALKDLIHFAENLAVLLESGVSLDKALAILTEVTRSRRFRTVIADIHTRVREGMHLADAVDAQVGAFPPVFAGLVRAGEQGGILETVLKRLAEYFKGVQEIREYLVAALIYPAILTLTSLVSLAVLMTFVIPKFAAIFADIGVALPWATQVLLSVGGFMQEWWWALLLGLLLVALILRAIVRSTAGRRVVDRLKLTAPLVGAIFVRIEVARLAATLGTLLGNGVAILPAMNMVRASVTNVVFAQDLARVYGALKEGQLLTTAIKAIPYFPTQAAQLIGVGEETGRLDSLLAKVAEIYDKDLRVAIKAFTSMIEPAIILIMGSLIGLMVVSMLVAIFSINQVQF